MNIVKQLIYLFVLIPNLILTQTSDSLIVKQIDSLIKVSRDLTAKKEFKKALEVNSIAENIVVKEFGKESVYMGNCYFNRGRVNYFEVNYPESEKWYLLALDIHEKIYGKEHLEFAPTLNGLGILYYAMGKYELAESYNLKVKAIREIYLGKDHPEYAKILNNLALLYHSMGNYEKAEQSYLESKAILEKIAGNENSLYIASLNNLANLYKDMGNYKKAEGSYIEAKILLEKSLNQKQQNYPEVINNLGLLYDEMGNYEKAELLFLESKAIWEKSLGKEHPNYATSLNNLGLLYKTKRNYEKAEQFLIESKDIREKTLGKEHSKYVSSLNNLGLLYKDMGNYKKAENFFLECKAIREKLLGKEHPDYAGILINIAILNRIIGNYEKAELLFIEAMVICNKVLGKEHQNYIICLEQLANIYESQSLLLTAEQVLQEMQKISQDKLLKASTFLSEQELAKYSDIFKESGEYLSTYLYARQKSRKQSGILPMLLYDYSLFYKGFLLNAAARFNSNALFLTDSIEMYQRFKSYRRRLAIEYAKPIAEQKGIVELEEKVNTIEKHLVRSFEGYSEVFRKVKWEDVKSSLKIGNAAIEFINFRVKFPQKTDSIVYAALLLKPNENRPIFIPLFEERAIDSLLQSKSERRADYVNTLYTLADRGAVVIGAPKKSLYEILWEPIEKELSGIKTIYFSPSGLLHRINLDAIPISQTETLADKYQLIELSSTRQLVITAPKQNLINDAVLYGGVHFDLDSAKQERESVLASRTNEVLSFNMVDSTLRSGTWTYLPGSEKEVNSIQKILMNSGFQTNLKSANEATEETFKRLGANNISSPRVLHIATHGYFFPDRTSSATGRMARDSAVSEGTAKTASIKPQFIESEEPVFKMSDHPMLRSGLIMAGGNAAWQGKQTLEGREDGILTAYEISQMNLSNTELVVLSACETGLGDIQGNEGVYGLQRAFKIAGAKYLIMSLWQVPDKQTSMLMISFYKKWLEHKMTIPDAFHAAQKELRDLGLDPYQWAGFVLVE
ncbi:MAG: CHAT domain-containing protein [Saprospiraceae bacterium]|nr:CHAT domain-containing protein [Saprospiraceae bacterium]